MTEASGRTPSVSKTSLPLVVALFIISLFLPFYFYLGSVLISPARLILLATIVPIMCLWAAGKCGKIIFADILVILLSIWMFLTFNLDGGASTFEYSVLSVVETITPYFLARYFVRSLDHYETMWRLLRWLIFLLLPAALIESLTGFRIYNTFFGFVFPTHPWVNYEPRLGMFRAQTVFEHPILYGVMIAFCVIPIFTLMRQTRNIKSSSFKVLPVVAATFLSLSAGAWMGAILQIMLAIWDRTLASFKARWKLLGFLFFILYLVVELGSNRPPFQFFSGYLAFDSYTAYWRYLILTHGLENVYDMPILGRGLNDWTRPAWMHSASIDNIWLVFAMRHGIPGFIVFLGAYAMAVINMARARPISKRIQNHRKALVFSLSALGVAIITVHLWSATYYFMMFMLGAGAWFSQVPQEDTPRKGVRDTVTPGSNMRVRPSFVAGQDVAPSQKA